VQAGYDALDDKTGEKLQAAEAFEGVRVEMERIGRGHFADLLDVDLSEGRHSED